jgi:hypothetical protein
MGQLNAFKAPELLVNPAEMVTELPDTVYPPPVNVTEWSVSPVILFWGLNRPEPVTAGKMTSSPAVGTAFSSQLAAVF